MTLTQTQREIRTVDRELNAIYAQMWRLEKIKPFSPESWQAAWDKHPDLHQAEHALFVKRGRLQLIRDEARSKVAAKERIASKRAEVKSATKRSGVFQYLYDCKESARRLGFPELVSYYSGGLETYRANMDGDAS